MGDPGDIKCPRFHAIEKDMLRTILGQPPSASVAIMYSDVNIVSIQLRRETRMLMYWGKLIRMPRTRHPRMILTLLNKLGLSKQLSTQSKARIHLVHFDQDQRGYMDIIDSYAAKALSCFRTDTFRFKGDLTKR